jgi:hypothetical protein
MRTALAALSLFLVVATPETARAQETAVRFPVASVSDTTFTFQIGQQRWVRQGLVGMVVDPRDQDVLVARFRVTRVVSGTARAVVIGQTTSLNSQHTVLLEVPAMPWYRQRFFWIGAGAGGLLGLLLGSI